MIILTLLVILISLILYQVFKIKKSYAFWKERGIPQLEPNWLYGDCKDLINRKMGAAEIERDFYFAFKKKGHKFGGFYMVNKPRLIVTDLELIKNVLLKDFNHFTAHHPHVSKSLFLYNLFHFDGDLWKDWRRKLTPTFTSGKMKMMYHFVFEKAVGLTDLVDKMVDSKKPAEIKELLARFTTDVIATCAFGIECNSINDDSSTFFQNGQKIFKRFSSNRGPPNPAKLLLAILGFVPTMRIADLSELDDFFRELVKQTVEYRETNKIVRKDFLQLLIQLKNKGTVTDLVNETDVYTRSNEKDAISMEDMVGQCILFFTAGFETSSTTMSFALLELTQNQDVQDKLRREVREVLKKHNGVMSYEAIQEMTYLEQVIYEALRKYPPFPNLPRMCTKKYPIPNTNVVLEKGTLLEIPLYGLHYDPEYYPNPEKFLPERFEHKKNDFTFLSFGEGPRMCLGLRFGVMQSKTGLASLINKFRFTLSPKTAYPPKFSPTSPILTVNGGIWLNAERVA